MNVRATCFLISELVDICFMIPLQKNQKQCYYLQVAFIQFMGNSVTCTKFQKLKEQKPSNVADKVPNHPRTKIKDITLIK